MKKLTLFMGACLMTCSLGAQLLETHSWQDRLLLIFASDAESAELHHQLELLTAEPGEVTERDLKIYRIFPGFTRHPDGRQLPIAASEQLYTKYGIKPGRGFVLLLIGKDGTEKLRAEEVVLPERIYSLIDSMPMRRREMKERQ